jgi:hypothetical protein
MTKAPGSTVLRQIENGLTIQVIEVETDWTPEEIDALATEEGYARTDDGTYRYLTEGAHLAIVTPEDSDTLDTDPDGPEPDDDTPIDGDAAPLTDPAALIAAGTAHDYEDVQEAAREAAAWLDILAERIIQAEHHRAAVAEVEHYEQLLHAARIKAGLIEPEEAVAEPPAYDAKTVRAWAAANGVDCPTRGTLPRRVLDAYLDAHEAGAT